MYLEFELVVDLLVEEFFLILFIFPTNKIHFIAENKVHLLELPHGLASLFYVFFV